MDLLEAREEYLKARRLAQKEVRELRNQGRETIPAVLDEILGETYTATTQDMGVLNIPVERIVGTKTAGRISAFPRDYFLFWMTRQSLRRNGCTCVRTICPMRGYETRSYALSIWVIFISKRAISESAY